MASGNIGFTKLQRTLEQVNRLSDYWFELIEQMMKGKEREDRRFAMSQLGRLIEKTMPTDLTSLGEAIKITIVPEILERDFTPSTKTDSSGQPPV